MSTLHLLISPEPRSIVVYARVVLYILHVSVCSQDLWTGTVAQASAATFGYFFSGHLLLEAVLDALDKEVRLLCSLLCCLVVLVVVVVVCSGV